MKLSIEPPSATDRGTTNFPPPQILCQVCNGSMHARQSSTRPSKDVQTNIRNFSENCEYWPVTAHAIKINCRERLAADCDRSSYRRTWPGCQFADWRDEEA